MLRDMGIPGVSTSDGRWLEVVATGLPLAGGAPLAVDATMVSPLHADGTPWPAAATRAGAALARAEASKVRTYPELAASPLVSLTTLACEVGGRWSQKCCDVVTQLARAKARESPRRLRTSAFCVFQARWWSLLSCAQQDSLAATLVDDAVPLLDGTDAPEPPLADLLATRGE